ncbi:MAG: ankyrin repeat domain-containing protein [Planctomycetota bacterium]|jgi:cytohesin
MVKRERVVVALVLLFAGLALSGCAVQDSPELFTAIREGDLNYTRTILQENPKCVNSKDESGYTPLALAVRMGNKDLCEVLIANGAKLEAKGSYGTALHIAAQENHKDIVELLVARGVKVNVKDKDGLTPLYYASTFGQGRKRNDKNDWNIARLLVSNGANVNMKSGSSDTPLHSAALYAPKEIVRLFLDNGADVNVRLSSLGWSRKSNNGPAPLHNACMRADRDIEIVELLIAAGADVNAKCYSEKADSWTPLFFACVHENTKAVELLTAKRAKIHVRSESGSTPMHYVPNAEIAQILIDNRANIHYKNKDGYSPLHNAVKAGRMDVVKLLIDKRAYVTTINFQGTSLLHEAAVTNQKEMVELLVAEGVNVNAKDRAGMTPARVAEKAGHDDVAYLLRQYSGK